MASPALVDVATRFGAFPVDLRDVVTFPSGLPGFEHCRRYVVAAASALEPFVCLHGLDDPGPSFLLVDPGHVAADYRVPLSADDLRRLDAASGDALVWRVIVNLDAEGATVNLRAPIVVNPRRMRGLQVLANDVGYPVDHRWSEV
jgi:flagellar assembly factor FliW